MKHLEIVACLCALALTTVGIYIAVDDYALTKRVILEDIESRKQVEQMNAAVAEACKSMMDSYGR